MNIFKALTQDHDRQRQLLDELQQTKASSQERKSVYAELKEALNEHAIAEERHFYTPLIQDDRTQEKARHSIAEHHDIDELIEALDELDPSSKAWDEKLNALKHQVLHHLDEEEQEVFPIADQVLDDQQQAELASDYHEEMSA